MCIKWHSFDRYGWHNYSGLVGTACPVLYRMQYFNEQKQKAQDLQSQITQTDREIDRKVYELYGLTEEEIKIVEESVG